MSIKIGVIGCLGKMGKSIVNELLLGNYNAVLSVAVARPGSKQIGKDIGSIINNEKIGVNITDSLEDLFDNSDVVIDFSTPATTLKCLNIAIKKNKPVVSGTTGLGEVDLTKYADIPFLWSANMSMGINVLSKLVEETAKLLKNKYDIEIWEMHHNEKQDSPSGTAIMLGKAAAKGLNDDLKIQQHLCNTNKKRLPNNIGFAVSRGGGIIGEHNVMFVNSDERIELKHMAINRNIFSKGAIISALWLHGKPPGLYSMLDVFN